MKRVSLLWIIVVSLLQTSMALAQRQSTLYVSPSKVVLPHFTDINRFKKDIAEVIPLKMVYDQQKKDTLIGVYTYAFKIDFGGKVVALPNHNPEDFGELQRYVDSAFTTYKWSPAFRKGCSRCKLLSYQELAIFFNTEDEEPNVYIEIDMLHRPKQQKRVLFSSKIPYSQLLL